ncbi:hypothetical protein E1B28_011957 [Marasmius oreades]|uniref:DUF6699 domain-containing protein n=1 Tax=Marasmius oreades TaxID=181124 RepID=A0A9P7RR70_9AGAR|nr:uncharacterized protein E1B28_011957 [Marasmius oreades]KAG7087908.1 hypothetical protein E1B28_011957 [Marasmius oreades]
MPCDDSRRPEASYVYPSVYPSGDVSSQSQSRTSSAHDFETYSPSEHISVYSRYSGHSNRTSTTVNVATSYDASVTSAYELHDAYSSTSTYHRPSSSRIGTVCSSSGAPSILSTPSHTSPGVFSSDRAVTASLPMRFRPVSNVSETRMNEEVLPETFVVSPFLRPNPPVIFDVTRPLRSIRTDSNARGIGTMSDPATSPPIRSGYLVLKFSFPGLRVEDNLLQTCVVSQHHSGHDRILSVWDVYAAISAFLGENIPKETLIRLLQASNGKESRRAERRGRPDVRWIDVLKDGTLFFALRIVGLRRGTYVIAEVDLRQP